VNRTDLRHAADREGIRTASYSLEGGLPPEKYVLALEEGGWSVYYSERGRRAGLNFFDTEDEACDYLFNLLIKDPTTRERNPHS